MAVAIGNSESHSQAAPVRLRRTRADEPIAAGWIPVLNQPCPTRTSSYGSVFAVSTGENHTTRYGVILRFIRRTISSGAFRKSDRTCRERNDRHQQDDQFNRETLPSRQSLTEHPEHGLPGIAENPTFFRLSVKSRLPSRLSQSSCLHQTFVSVARNDHASRANTLDMVTSTWQLHPLGRLNTKQGQAG